MHGRNRVASWSFIEKRITQVKISSVACAELQLLIEKITRVTVRKSTESHYADNNKQKLPDITLERSFCFKWQAKEGWSRIWCFQNSANIVITVELPYDRFLYASVLENANWAADCASYVTNSGKGVSVVSSGYKVVALGLRLLPVLYGDFATYSEGRLRICALLKRSSSLSLRSSVRKVTTGRDSTVMPWRDVVVQALVSTFN